MALRARARPHHAGAGRLELRGARHDLVTQLEHDIAPSGAAAFHVAAVDKVADADGGADTVIGEPLHMIDQVLAREGFLRHRPIGDVLETKVTVQVDHGGHHGLAGEIDRAPAPAGATTSARRPDVVKRLPSTRNAEFSITARHR